MSFRVDYIIISLKNIRNLKCLSTVEMLNNEKKYKIAFLRCRWSFFPSILLSCLPAVSKCDARNWNLSPSSYFIMTSMGYRITVKHLPDVIGRLLTVIFGVFQTSTPAAPSTRKILRSPLKWVITVKFFNDNLSNLCR